MCNFRRLWYCSNDIKPVLYGHYVHDIFALLSSVDHSNKFKEYLSSNHPQVILFHRETKNSCLTFSDLNIFRKNGNSRLTFTGKRQWSALEPPKLNDWNTWNWFFGTLFGYLIWCFLFVKFYHEVNKLKNILPKSS